MKNGNTSLKEIPQPITGMFIIYEDEYINMKTGETLTKEQYNKTR